MRKAFVYALCLGFTFLFVSSLQAQTVLQFPRIISNSATYTGIAVGNPTTAEVSVTFTAFQSDGAILSGSGVRNPVTLKIPAGGQAAKLFPEIFGIATFDGWVQATSSSGGLTGFFLNGNTALTDLDGASAVEPAAEFIFPLAVQDAITKTELTIVNVNSDAATATLTLYAKDGRELGTKDLSFAARGLIRQDIKTIFPDVDLSAASHAKVRSPRPLIGHEVVSSYLITATAPPRESIALSAMEPTAQPTYVLPQFASGNGWTSVIGIVNAAGIGQEITLRAYKEDGTLWPAPSNPKRISIDANEGVRATVDELFGFSSDTNAVGWIKVESTLGFVVSYIGYGNTLTPSFALVRGTDTTRAARYEVFSHVAEGSGFYSGLTLVNPGTDPASVEFYTLRADGTTVGRTAFTVGPNQRIGKLFSEFIPSTLDQLGGWAFLRSSQPVIAAVLFGTSSGSALASVPQQLPAGDFIPPAQNTGAISGTVRSSNGPVAGVQIALTGPVTTTRTTDATGRYNFPQLPNGDYKVTASLSGFVLAPTQRSVTINRQNADGVDFDASGAAPEGTPVIQLISPASAFAGSNAMNLRVFGTDFAPSSIVRLNGFLLQTTFVSSNELEALVTAARLTATGTFALIVETPPPGGGTSNRVDFGINATTSNSLIIGRATVGSFPAGVAFDRVRGNALVTNQSSDNISVVDLKTFQSKASIPVGRSPAEGIAVHSGLNLALVANPGSGNVSVVDLTKNQEVKKIPVGKFPVGLAINPNTNRALVVNAEDDNVSVIDLNSLSVLTQIPVGTLPASVAINSRTNEAVVTNRGGNTVSIIDLNANAVVNTLRVGQSPRGVAVSTLTNVAVVANANSNDATIIDLKAKTVLFTAKVGTAPTGVAIHEFADSAIITNSGVVNGSRDFGVAGTVSVLAIGTREITATIPVGSAPFGVDVDQENQVAVVANFGSNDVTGIRVPNPRPRVDDVQPRTFPPGGFTTFTITGAGFVPASVVNVNSQPLPTTYVSPSQLKADLSAALADSLLLITGISSIGSKGGVFAAVTPLQFNISVTNPPPGGGESASDPSITRIFPQNPVPVLVSISPTESNVGASLTLTLSGNNFNGTSIINFGTNSYSPQSVSHTGMSVTIPANEISAGTKTVNVTNPAPGGGSTQTLSFTVNDRSNPPPVVTSVSPAEVAVESGPVTVTVTGTGFSSFTTATLAGVSGNVSGNTITFNLTATQTNNTGTLQGLVTNPTPGGGSAEFSVNVTSGAPIITAFTPNSVTAGSQDTVIQVTGTNFLASTQITLEGTPIPTTRVSATQLTGTIPAEFLRRSGNERIGVTTPSPGGGASAIGTFQIVAPKPVLQSVTPARAPSQTRDLTVTLGGSGFAGNTTALIGTQKLSTVYTSSTALSATIPAALLGNAGVLTIVVTTPAPGGGTSNSVTFTVENPVPAVTSVTPSIVRADQTGAVITVVGSNFVNGASIVIGGRSLVTTFVSAAQLTGILAVPMPLGIQSLTVTNSSPGGGSSNGVNFEVIPLPPTITSVIPSTAVPGQTIRITGTNFGQGSIVLLGGVPVTTVTISDTELTATIPVTTAPGPTTVVVRNPAGSASAPLDSPPVTIQSVSPPVLTSVSPTSSDINTTLTIRVTGSNFFSGSVVMFNTSALQTTFINTTALDAVVTLPSTPGSATIRVVNPGNVGSNTLPFDVTAPVPTPTLYQIIPDTANVGTVVGVTLSGSDFVSGGTTVSITGTGVAVSNVNVTDSSSLTATFTISANAPVGRRDVTVTTIGGTSKPLIFTVDPLKPPPPTLTSITPTSGIQGDTVPVTLTGTGFLAGATTVSFSGSGILVNSVSVTSSTSLTANITISANAALGTRNVTVSTSNGTSGAVSFDVQPLLIAINSPASIQDHHTPDTFPNMPAVIERFADGLAHYRLGHWDEPIAAFRAALELHPDDAARNLRQGNLQLKEGNSL